MILKVDLPTEVELSHVAEANARGVSVDAIARQVPISGQPSHSGGKAVFERGLGLFGSPEDATLLDEVVAMAYEHRRRPTTRPVV